MNNAVFPNLITPAMILAGTLLLDAPVHADIVYSYIGNPFTDIQSGTNPPISLNDFVTASFTVSAPLPADFNGALAPLT
jgi:hypothetical protein